MTKREKIFHAGAKLFAERSFNSVGIRDIAGEAGVNSAMISYYFGSKVGLLREIFASFKDSVLAVAVKSMGEAEDHYALVEINVASFLNDARKNRNIYLVGLRELNHDSPELQDLRDELNLKCWGHFSEFLKRTGGKNQDSDEIRDITFTAVMGIIFSDYLLGGGQFIDDDDKFETYKSVIIGILKMGSPSIWS